MRAHVPRLWRRPGRFAPALHGLVLLLLALACGTAWAHGPLAGRIAELTRAIERATGDAALRLERADLWRLDGHFDDAQDDLARAAALDPALPRLELVRGALAFDRGRFEEAVAALGHHLERTPDDGEARVMRARAFVHLGKHRAAAAEYEPALAGLVHLTPELAIERATAWTEAGEWERALEGLDAAIGQLGAAPGLERMALAIERRLGRADAADAREWRAHGSEEHLVAATPEPLVPPAIVPMGGPTQTTLVPRSASWRYLTGPDPAPAGWTTLAFDHAAWPAGFATLGYGDPFIVTTVPYGPSASDKWRTTYFRRVFTVSGSPASFQSLSATINYDDGFVLYLNGVEIARRAMPPGPIAYATFASDHEGGAFEPIDLTSVAGLLQPGLNVLAAEVHQATTMSTDLAWDMDLVASTSAAVVTRGPYLQLGTPTSVVVRWRTATASDTRVWWGDAPGAWSGSASLAPTTTEHEIAITGLVPATRYYYAVGTSAAIIAGGDDTHTFLTTPLPGTETPVRAWVIGDAGTNTTGQRRVRDAYEAYAAGHETDLWLMLGDNAYGSGTDTEYQGAVFDVYPERLRRSVVWPTRGNHDLIHAGVGNDYYDLFTLPTGGEAGGVPSGTEAYYSFDHGNVHFICLDSEGTSRSPSGAMLTWLRADLAASTAPWVIAYWHHPPYTKGSHDSDNPGDSGGRMHDMRANALPILDSAGVDVVLTGHSHSYERSFLLNGHYDVSSTLTPDMAVDPLDGREGGDGPYRKPTPAHGAFEGAVYVVAGSSGQVSGGTLDHPVMVSSLNQLGSLVLDIAGARLDARFLDDLGVVRDSFTILKGGALDVPRPEARTLRIEVPSPNPGRNRQQFAITLARAGRARLAIVGVDGRRIVEVLDERRDAGAFTVAWDGRDRAGRVVPPGVYVAVLESAGETRAVRFVRAR